LVTEFGFFRKGGSLLIIASPLISAYEECNQRLPKAIVIYGRGVDGAERFGAGLSRGELSKIRVTTNYRYSVAFVLFFFLFKYYFISYSKDILVIE
jgi:hypothetical protein